MAKLWLSDSNSYPNEKLQAKGIIKKIDSFAIQLKNRKERNIITSVNMNFLTYRNHI